MTTLIPTILKIILLHYYYYYFRF